MTRYSARLFVLVLTIVPLASQHAQADEVLQWNEIAMSTLEANRVNPFEAARVTAILHTAVFEAVNAVTGRYEPYLWTVSAPRGASPRAAAVAAAHAVLVHYYPASAAVLDPLRASSLAAIDDGQDQADGVAVGVDAAADVIAHRSNDGSTPPRFFFPSSGGPGEWQTTPSCPPAGGILLHWQDVTPFGIKTSSQFRSAPPPALTSLRYAIDLHEVKSVGAAASTRRPERLTTVARFYNAALAAAVWNSVARQLAVAKRASLSYNARAFALLNMAISDGLVSSMETKYHYRLWRPETAIHVADIDGNPATKPDETFVPLITAPCFPSYPSAHASGSYAGRRLIERLFGTVRRPVVLTTAALPGVALTYTNLSDITDDIDDARIYGGIHFRFDQRAGARQGRAVGDFVFEQHLRPRHAWHPRGTHQGEDR
jgi:hypothetical protein